MECPPDTAWYVKTFRFMNLLDPDFNQLSPVRIQAWVATAQMAGVAFSNFLAHHADGLVSGVSVLYAGLAHVIHQTDKNNRAKNAARLGGPDVPGN